ncbi:hypothetical protein HYE66_11700 [Aggregatibacter actinomycetemcomitans]|nr:hypothetical protein [Aggregatibacter actinomycetemcomitans]
MTILEELHQQSDDAAELTTQALEHYALIAKAIRLKVKVVFENQAQNDDPESIVQNSEIWQNSVANWNAIYDEYERAYMQSENEEERQYIENDWLESLQLFSETIALKESDTLLMNLAYWKIADKHYKRLLEICPKSTNFLSFSWYLGEQADALYELEQNADDFLQRNQSVKDYLQLALKLDTDDVDNVLLSGIHTLLGDRIAYETKVCLNQGETLSKEIETMYQQAYEQYVLALKYEIDKPGAINNWLHYLYQEDELKQGSSEQQHKIWRNAQAMLQPLIVNIAKDDLPPSIIDMLERIQIKLDETTPEEPKNVSLCGKILAVPLAIIIGLYLMISLIISLVRGKKS